MLCTGDINTLEMMERMLDAEQPDLVVYTGDNVDGLTSKDAYAVSTIENLFQMGTSCLYRGIINQHSPRLLLLTRPDNPQVLQACGRQRDPLDHHLWQPRRRRRSLSRRNDALSSGYSLCAFRTWTTWHLGHWQLCSQHSQAPKPSFFGGFRGREWFPTRRQGSLYPLFRGLWCVQFQHRIPWMGLDQGRSSRVVPSNFQGDYIPLQVRRDPQCACILPYPNPRV